MTRYFQRERSWNAFNARVMKEALRKKNALPDRLKFAAIVSSNYDEFFQVRVARLMRDAAESDRPVPPDGERPSEILSILLSEIRSVTGKQDDLICDEIFPLLAKAGLVITKPKDWDDAAAGRAAGIFENELFPLATPVSVRRPLADLVTSASIYAAFLLDDDDLAVVRLPENLERLRRLRSSGSQQNIILLEDILLTFGSRFFPGRAVLSSCCFRVTRDADMSVDEERDEDFIAAMEEVLERRKTGFPVRLETRGDGGLAARLRKQLDLSAASHFHFRAPLNFKDFFSLAFPPGVDRLRSPVPLPSPAADLADSDDLWETLKDRDVLLHHPYESYKPVIRMVEEAAEDSRTLAIKMTLYRTSGNSPVVAALVRAAQAGIQVTAVVEVKARFDEGANIGWAAQLEQAGAIVIYGLAVLKVHAKMLMVVRREADGIRRYLHLGTGNYNDKTARLYTDMGLMTSRENYTADAALVFNAITGYSSEPKLNTLFMAPFSLRHETLRLIGREEERARNGEEAAITAKMNSLVDPEIIDALYRASEAGVIIRLNIRGICALRPQVPRMSSNIQVVSVIDTFLEHTRAFVYHNGGRTEVYLSSADWMTRNLDRRAELLFPVAGAAHKRRIISAVEDYFRDNCRSWELGADGNWKERKPGKQEKKFRVQEHFMQTAALIAGERDSTEQKALSVRRRPPGQLSS